MWQLTSFGQLQRDDTFSASKGGGVTPENEVEACEVRIRNGVEWDKVVGGDLACSIESQPLAPPNANHPTASSTKCHSHITAAPNVTRIEIT